MEGQREEIIENKKVTRFEGLIPTTRQTGGQRNRHGKEMQKNNRTERRAVMFV